MTAEAGKWIYERTDDNLARFVLGTSGNRPLICVGLNPSTAGPGSLDATMSRVRAVAAAHGFDSILMLNLSPVRATRPRDLPPHADPALAAANLKHCVRLLAGRTDPVWAAWGTNIAARPYLVRALHELVAAPELASLRWMSRGTLTRAGHPRHPLYVRTEEPLVPFDVRGYLDGLGLERAKNGALRQD